MKPLVAGLLFLCLWPGTSRAADIDLAAMTCLRYQNEMIGPDAPTPTPDPINTMMWLFGYAVAKSGAHVMYGDALAGFGFALDAECKKNPAENLLAALAVVKPSSKNAMDLSTLECGTFAARHSELNQSDPESAKTIMMWLFGFAVASSGSHHFNSGALAAFEPVLLADCGKNPERSLYSALVAIKFAGPRK